MEQNTPSSRKEFWYAVAAFASGTISMILQMLSLAFFYDPEIGYFQSGALLPIVATTFSIASLLFFAVFSFLKFRNKEMAYPKTTHPAVKLASAPCAALSLLLGIHDLKSGASILGLLFCFGACLYFLLVMTSKGTPALYLAFGFCAILRCMSTLSNSYVNFYLPMNSPEKLWISTAIGATMLFLICEIRALVTKPYTATWFFSAATAVAVLWPSSLILILGSREGVFYQPTDTNTMIFALLLFSLAIYAMIRLFTLAISPLPNAAAEITEETVPTEEIEVIEEIQTTEEIEETEEIQETEPTEETDNE